MRHAVVNFAEQMEARLKEHDVDKGGWGECTFRFLLDELKYHVEDLEEAIFEQGIFGNVEQEAADIANFAMMIRDNFNNLRKKR